MANAFAKLVVFDQPDAALADWARLEAIAPASIYQTSHWVTAWLQTIGRANGIKPMLVMAYDCNEMPLMMLPLGVKREHGLNVARYLGGRDSNFNMPLCKPTIAFNADDMRAVLKQAAKLATLKVDVFSLSNQVEAWEGIANPLLALPHQPSPSFGYKTVLQRDGEAFLQSRWNPGARKKHNYKLRKLAAIGALKLLTPDDLNDSAPAIAAYLTQKTARFSAMGLPLTHDAATERLFLTQASAPAPGTHNAAMKWWALTCNGAIIACFAGGEHRGRLHGMVTSFAMDAQFSGASPGDLLIQRVIVDACARGIGLFDLGVGEARYKSSWCDVPEPLFDCVIPVSLSGHVFATIERVRLSLKRTVKQTPWIWHLVLQARRMKKRG